MTSKPSPAGSGRAPAPKPSAKPTSTMAGFDKASGGNLKLDGIEIEQGILDYYLICIAYIRHENDLLNHRTTWFLAIQGALGAGAGYVFKEYFESTFESLAAGNLTFNANVFEGHCMWLFCCLLGIFVSYRSAQAINAALKAHQTIEKLWNDKVPTEIRACLPDMRGGKVASEFTKDKGASFARGLPYITTGIWVVFLALGFLPFAWKVAIGSLP